MQRYYNSGGTLTEDPSQRTYYYYDTNPFNSSYSQYAAGRLAAVQYSGGNCSSYTTPMSGCDTIEEWYSYSSGGAVVGKWLHLIRGSAQGDLSASWTYDNEGRMTGVTYPQWTSLTGGGTIPGSNYTYAMDTMGRLSTMTDTLNSHTLVSGASYGPSNELLSLSGSSWGVDSETRTYNSRLQLTNLNVGYGYAVVNMTYGYSSLNNNGKIAAQTDAISGEQIVYTYDALNRLATAVTSDNPSVTQWGQSYTYDGFGNLLDQTIIKGAGPSESTTYDPTTNRQTGESADANGNIFSGSGYWNNVFDIENRLVHPGGTTAYYAYDPGNKRVWRGDSSVSLDEVDFFSAGGQKLATYQVSLGGMVYVNGSYFQAIQFTLTSSNVYFGGKLVSKGTNVGLSGGPDQIALAAVAADRLGSIGKFYPYGQEKPSATTNDTEKFTGYFRDAASGLDYADQRYHQPGMGRFMTPDRYQNSAGLSDPGSWNRYAYTRGDPVNRVDPGGTCDQMADDFTSLGCLDMIYNGGAGEDGYMDEIDQEQQQAALPSPTPCTQVSGQISDPTVVERLMNENSLAYVGDIPSLFTEDLWIMSAIVNRMNTPGYNQPRDSANARVPNTLDNQALYANGPGRPTSLSNGVSLYAAALVSFAGSPICDDLIDAADAMNSVLTNGPVNTQVLNWFGKGQPPSFYPAPMTQINLTSFFGYITYPRHRRSGQI